MIQELCWEKVKRKYKRTGSRGGRDTEMETGTGREEHGDMTERCQKIRQRNCQRKVEAKKKWDRCDSNTAGMHADKSGKNVVCGAKLCPLWIISINKSMMHY